MKKFWILCLSFSLLGCASLNNDAEQNFFEPYLTDSSFLYDLPECEDYDVICQYFYNKKNRTFSVHIPDELTPFNFSIENLSVAEFTRYLSFQTAPTEYKKVLAYLERVYGKPHDIKLIDEGKRLEYVFDNGCEKATFKHHPKPDYANSAYLEYVSISAYKRCEQMLAEK